MLDTNVVLDLLHFDDVTARPLRLALEAAHVRCVVTDGTLEEWRRVLGYPEFDLDPAQQTALVARYKALSEMAKTVELDASLSPKGAPIHYGLLYPLERKPVWSRMPHCSDPDDQKFIDLAAAVQAQVLISKDRAVLKLRRCCAPYFQIMTPAEAVHWLGNVLVRTDSINPYPAAET